MLDILNIYKTAQSGREGDPVREVKLMYSSQLGERGTGTGAGNRHRERLSDFREASISKLEIIEE